jgi:hypothetical protein
VVHLHTRAQNTKAIERSAGSLERGENSRKPGTVASSGFHGLAPVRGPWKHRVISAKCKRPDIAKRHGVPIPEEVDFFAYELGELVEQRTACGPRVDKPAGSIVEWTATRRGSSRGRQRLDRTQSDSCDSASERRAKSAASRYSPAEPSNYAGPIVAGPNGH